jgi:hypothetical protein
MLADLMRMVRCKARGLGVPGNELRYGCSQLGSHPHRYRPQRPKQSTLPLSSCRWSLHLNKRTDLCVQGMAYCGAPCASGHVPRVQLRSYTCNINLDETNDKKNCPPCCTLRCTSYSCSTSTTIINGHLIQYRSNCTPCWDIKIATKDIRAQMPLILHTSTTCACPPSCAGAVLSSWHASSPAAPGGAPPPPPLHQWQPAMQAAAQ